MFAAVRESGPVVPRIVGRDGELAVVRDVLDGVGDGPATLALWGDTGIGKSTIWEAAVAQARRRGFTVLASRPAAPEVHLSYAGLADLLADVDAEVVAGLPVPQQRALDAALLRGFEDEATADPRAVAAGLQSVINVVAAAGPIVVAIDDLQWLDEPTRRVLAFAIRRCHGPMVMLSAERAEWEPGARIALWPADPGRLRDLNVPPLSLGALH